MMMYECDWVLGTLIKCDDYATVEVAGYPWGHYYCSLHAGVLAGKLGATPGELEKINAEGKVA